MNKDFKGTLEELMEELPTAAITPVYRICEKNGYPEERIINVRITGESYPCLVKKWVKYAAEPA